MCDGCPFCSDTERRGRPTERQIVPVIHFASFRGAGLTLCDRRGFCGEPDELTCPDCRALLRLEFEGNPGVILGED